MHIRAVAPCFLPMLSLCQQVRQSDPGDAALKATNGRMLATLLQNQSYTSLEPQVCA